MSKPIIFATLMALSLAGQAQPPEAPVGYSGALIEYSDTSVTLKDSKADKAITVAMTPGWFVSTAKELTFAAIKPGNFVATANTNLDAHTGKSTELRIFEPGYKPEEGTHEIPRPNTSMTHGTVKTATVRDDGVELEIVYLQGSRRIIVPPDVKVTGYDVHARTVLKPGMIVTAITRKGTDGVPRAGRLLMTGQ